MEEAGELNWDIEPTNGKNIFFSQESYAKYSLGPSLEELFLLCNKQAAADPEAVPGTSEAQDIPLAATQSQENEVSTPVKRILLFPEPRVPYPHYSCLTASEQDIYVKLMIKFINCTHVGNLQMEHSHYMFLKSKVSSEHSEFQKFLQNAARSCPEDYDVLCDSAARYNLEMIKPCQEYVRKYPQLYSVHAITSMLGGKFIPDLSLNLEKCILKMGRVNFVHAKFPTDDILLDTTYNNICKAVPPVKKARHLHKKLTSDPNIPKLVSKYRPHVVLTGRALFTLLNNHGPEYNEQWEIPVRVETQNDGGISTKVVYVDSPLPKKVQSTREESQMFHEVVLDKFMVKNSVVPLEAVSLDRKEDEWLADQIHKNRKLACESRDFENDVTELETFGTLDSENSDDKSAVDDSEEMDQSESETQKSSTSDMRPQSLVHEKSETDSDEEKLVIDDCKKSSDDLNTSAVSETTTIKSPVATSDKISRKASRKISKDADPLGQILKMQTQLLKPGPRKIEPAATISPEKKEQLPQNSIHFPNFSSQSFGSFQEPQRMATTTQKDNKKSLLSNDLLDLQEDANEYTLGKEKNRVYKLFSLADILLLLQSSVHSAVTTRMRTLDKVSKKQIPVFVLTKMDYQYCYGVESLTESESCRLWTESLIHSKCTLYVGHVDAFTSKFFMLEEVPAEKLKEKMSIFNPTNCLNTLRHILKWLTGLEDGSYLLSHASKDVSIHLYKSATDKRGNYDLHEAHSNPPKAPSSLSVPWVPLNPNLLLNYHIQHGRPPCTFPPDPATNHGNTKNNQVKTAPSQDKASKLPNTGLPITSPMGRNRLFRWKTKQKRWKAEAQSAKKANT